jgi:hypothetical protein
MSRRSFFTAFAATAFIFVLSGRAQAIVIYGDGMPSCESWSDAAVDSPARRGQVAWLLGFVSAYDWYSPNGEDIKYTDPKSMVEWADRYCAAHPQDLIARAAGKLIDELRRRRGLKPLMETQ